MTEEEKPLTREDVLKLIEENGGTAEGLDLRDRNLEEIDLSHRPDSLALDLHGIILYRANLKMADLSGADLQRADLARANLEKAWLGGANLQGAKLDGANLQGAKLTGTNLQGAELTDANLQEANLREAKLSRASLYGAKISRDTKLEQSNWGSGCIVGEEAMGDFKHAAHVYRMLKQWYTDAGMYDIAGRFYYREAEAIRKGLSWREKPWPKLWNWVFRLLCGYAERPERVVFWAAVVVLSMAGIYTASALSFPSALYYSAASFTALGYGLWVSAPEGWVKALGTAEAFIGVFLIALFLITFVRKMTR
ncbi:MAG: hypothetical protein E3J65_02210 [Dehalococcoidia bacterium]|nr:MAG: hypothetical protein E3J65_02210 [Dehalococcoidia bacterium]